ncbi:MAG: hypothetical protein FWE40_09155 [Oscillospiraceae bacterium]|nr:hypothetical protein [Oscillospiraceae bacterium]
MRFAPHSAKTKKTMQQRVEITYKMIGHVQLPMLDKKQTQRLQISFGRGRDVLALAA